MTARIALTAHADQRIVERLAPHVGSDAAVEAVADVVLDAHWNGRYRRRAPRWIRACGHPRSSVRRYAVGRAGHVRFTAVVDVSDAALPRIVTVLTDAMGPRPLAPLPALGEGVVIGLPRTTPLPVAFQQVAA